MTAVIKVITRQDDLDLCQWLLLSVDFIKRHMDYMCFSIKILRIDEDTICLQFKSDRKNQFITISFYHTLIDELELDQWITGKFIKKKGNI